MSVTFEDLVSDHPSVKRMVLAAAGSYRLWKLGHGRHGDFSSWMNYQQALLYLNVTIDVLFRLGLLVETESGTFLGDFPEGISLKELIKEYENLAQHIPPRYVDKSV